MRVIQLVTSDISAPLPLASLPFKTVCKHARTRFGLCNAFLSLTMTDTVWSVSQRPAKKETIVPDRWSRCRERNPICLSSYKHYGKHHIWVHILKHLTKDARYRPISLPLWAPAPPWLASSLALVLMVMALLCRGLSVERRVVSGRDPEWLQIPLPQ